jgi:O-antigen/teichoic acid export membrane protein
MTVGSAPDMRREGRDLTGKRVARNVMWNLLGQGAPLAVAVGCIPFLARTLGIDRFSLLALCWSVIGYFGIFDLGLGQAMTRSVAQKLANREHDTIHVTVWTTLTIMVVVGIAGMVVALLLAPFIIHALRIPASLRPEALDTFRLLAVSIPLVITSVGLRGILEAHQEFKRVNAVRIPLGIWSYAAPLTVTTFSRSLVVIVGILLLGRVAAFALYLISCLRVLPSLASLSFSARLVRPLITFGGWLTLDNLMDPIGGLLDRFLIGALVSVAAVGYFAVPYQVATAAWVLPVALNGVLFPTFTRAAVRDRNNARLLFNRGLKYLLIAAFPVTLVMVALAQPGLLLWVGPDFATRSTVVLQLLAVGTLITSIGSVADTFIQSAGRPDASAKLAVGKVATYLLLAWPVIGTYGIDGAAALWVMSTGLEALGMFVVALHLQGRPWTSLMRHGVRSLPGWLILGVAAIPLPMFWRVAYLAAVLLGSAMFTWRYVLNPDERAFLHARLGVRPAAASTVVP